MIEVRLFATFRVDRGKILFLEPEAIKNGRELIDLLKIPADEVSIFLINGRHKKLEDAISDEDVIALFPPVGGG